MRISALRFPALRYGFFHFSDFIPKLLRYDRFMRIFYYYPFAFVFLIPLVILIRNRTPTLLRHTFFHRPMLLRLLPEKGKFLSEVS